MTVNLFLLISALALAVYFRQLIQSFHCMNLSELRRRADLGHHKAEKVLLARMHGLRLWFILWGGFGLMIFAIAVILSQLLSIWAATVIGVVMLTSLLFIPWVGWPRPKLDSAAAVSPYLVSFLDRIQIVAKVFHPLKLSEKIDTDLPPSIHSKEHMIEIMEDLKSKTKSRKVMADLDLAISTLTFSSKKIRTLMIPIDKTKKVKAAQNLTLKLVNNLHDSGFSVFPVQRSEGDFCGILYLEDVEKLSKANLIVHQVMRAEIYYVYDEAPLNKVLDAFLKTRQQLFLVVNQSRKILGLITLSDVLSCYLGNYQFDDFKYYDDLDLVVKRFASGQDSKQSSDAQSKAKSLPDVKQDEE